MADVFPGTGERSGAEEMAELAELLHRVNRHLRRRASEQLGRLGLTPAQARALRTLGRADTPLRMSALANQLGIARRSATSVVDELAERGLVRREADPTDRRATAVVLTREGRSTLGRVRELRHEALSELATGLSPEDLRALRTMLARLDGSSGGRSGPPES
jgi:DNA-binding MarR family transcriptional regulator